MKKLFLLAIVALSAASCMHTKQIGKLNMISNRNVDSKVEYVALKNYVGSSKKEIKRYRSETLEGAIDNIVKSVPGGEFVKNLRIYLVNGKKFAVEGDVWGLADNNFKGFKVGDSVQWTHIMQKHKGIIVNLKDDKSCTVKDLESGDLREVNYSELLKE